MTIRMTKNRKEILEILKSSPRPLTAQEIFEYMEKSNTKMNLSTVYRTLDIFESNGLFQSLDIPGTVEKHYIVKAETHKHYGLCMTCKKTLAIDSCPLDSYQPNFNEDFHIIGHSFMVYGYCKTCKDKG